MQRHGDSGATVAVSSIVPGWQRIGSWSECCLLGTGLCWTL